MLASTIGSSPGLPKKKSRWSAAETQVQAVTAFPTTGFAGIGALGTPMLGKIRRGSLDSTTSW